jgi:hypothetical protein
MNILVLADAMGRKIYEMPIVKKKRMMRNVGFV